MKKRTLTYLKNNNKKHWCKTTTSKTTKTKTNRQTMKLQKSNKDDKN